MTDEQKVAKTYTAPPLFGVMPETPEDHNDLPDPEHGPYFIVLKDGFAMVKMTHWGKTVIKVDSIPTFPEYKSSNILWYPEKRIPTALMAQLWSFFKQVYADIGTEVMVYITHKNGEYRIFVPEQEATKVSVNTSLKSEFLGDWQVVGTAHSHCDFSAYHSATDNHDADGMDGLHITLGHVNIAKPSIAIMISVNKIKWKLEPDEIFDQGMPIAPDPHPAWWHRYVKKGTQTVTQYGYGGHYTKPAVVTPNPPSQAPAQRGTNTHGSGNKSNNKNRNKNNKNKKISEAPQGWMSVDSAMDAMEAYGIWDSVSAEDLYRVREDLHERAEDLMADLAGIGIYMNVDFMPMWNAGVKRFSATEASREVQILADTLDYLDKRDAKTAEQGQTENTPSRNQMLDEDWSEINSLLGGH